MKVYNFVCDLHHPFEGWFSSEQDANDQQKNGLLRCPVCESNTATRLPSAPHIAKKNDNHLPFEKKKKENEFSNNGNIPLPAQIQATILNVIQELIKNSEDVCDNFAEEARKIHYQEAPQRNIRGESSAEEISELIEEGIDIITLPNISSIKNTLQ